MIEFPLTSAQRRIWFAEQLRDTGASYVLDASLRLSGLVRPKELASAVRRLAERHPMLRLRVRTRADGTPVQQVSEDPVDLRQVQAEGTTPAERRRDAENRLRQELSTPLPLTGPVFDPVLITVEPDEHLLAIPYHHLAGDGESSRVIRGELIALYEAECAGVPAELPSVKSSFLDSVVAIRQEAARRRVEAATAGARLRLAGAPMESTVPPDRPRPPRLLPAAHCVRIDLATELTTAVDTLARSRRLSRFLVYSAALHLLLRRYNGQSETLVGFMTGNRAAAERRTVGLYAQTAVQRLVGGDLSTVDDVLRRLRIDILAADEQRHAPLEDVVEALGQSGLPGRHPLFQAMIVLTDAGQELTGAGLTAMPTVEPVPLAWLDLELRLHPHPDGSVEGWLRAPTSLYDHSTVVRLARHFHALLAALVAADPTETVGTLPMLDPADRAEVLAASEGPRRALAGTLTGQLRVALHKHGDRPAVTFEGRTLTYHELRNRADALASRLAAEGIGPGSLVAVSTHRSIDLVVALVGVILAGAAFLPVDPDEPEARRAFMLDDLHPGALLGRAAAGPGGPPAHDIAELSDNAAALPPVVVGPAPGDLAYVIYTSGSTGLPKAVGNTQLGLVNRLAWMQEDHRLDETDSVVQKTPFTFDVSVWEFFWPLLAGARLVVARPGGHRDPAYLGGLIRGEGITTAHFVPSMLRAFIAAGELSGELPLRRVICSGEALPVRVAEDFLAAGAGELHNLYGPTEAAIDVTRHRCVAGADPVMPIGRPVPNTRVLVLDAHRQLVPFGGIGELYLGGVQLAAGYLNRPELTAERFVADPAEPDQRLYRTGDLARMRQDGVIEYLGRTDRQIKLRGLRVEPAEVEAALEAVDGVTQAAVDVSGTALVAFAAVTDPELTREALVARLSGRLPVHLVPGRIHLLPELPLSLNGKVDHGALLALDEAAPPAAPGTAEPASPTEERLLALVRSVVGRATVGVADSFFAVGGDSIRSIELVTRARAEGYALSVETIFGHPSVRQLAGVVGTGTSVPDEAAVAPFALLDDGVRAGLPDDVVDAFPLPTTLSGLLVESTQPGRYRVYTTSLRLRGDLVAEEMEQALSVVLRRHPFLRSAIRVDADGGSAEPVQLVHREVPAALAVIDLRSLPADERDRRVADWLEREQTVAFDWERPPLLRLTAHRLTDDEFQLTLAEPLLDGYSAALTLTELLNAYQQPGRLPVTEVRGYADYLAAQRTAVARSAGFWRDQLVDAPDSHVYGLDGGVERPEMSYVDIEFPGEVSAALIALNHATGVPLKSILLAAHVRAVATATMQSEVVTGLMANARPATVAGATTVGLFLNVNPLRVRIAEGTWWDLVEQVRQVEAETLPHRAYPFAQLRRDRLVDGIGTLFNFTHFHPYAKIAEGGRLRVLDRTANDQTYFPLTAQFQLDPLDQILAVRLEWFGAGLDEADREAVATLYRAAVIELARSPRSRHDIEPAVGGPTPYPQSVLDGEPGETPQALHRTFAAEAARVPDRVAVRGGGRQWTFAELAERADRITAALREHSVRPGEPVGVCLPREPWLVAALLGTVQAGSVYLPLDPGLPRARRDAMLAAARCRVVIAGPTAEHPAGGIVTVVPHGLSMVSSPAPAHPTDPEQAACLLFTSGSTGVPKGVLIAHRAMANRLAWGRRDAPFTGDDVLFARTAIAFVDSVAELLAGPLSGATTQLAGDAGDDPASLVRNLAAAGATRVTSVPTLLAEVLNLDLDLAGALPRLRHWTLSGEVLPAELAHEARRRLPDVRFLNLYGSTEVAADATAHVVRGDETGPTIPIGRPIDGAGVLVADPWGRPVPRLVAGRLVVTGAPVGAGYLNGGPGGFTGPPSAPTAFHTGDLARVDADGRVVFLGRSDRQIKIRGVRLEPAEIEAVLTGLPEVNAAVVAATGTGAAKSCTAYLVLRPGAAELEPRAVRQELRRRLPTAAIPDEFAVLDRLPLTDTGKVDHRALAAGARSLRRTEACGQPPRTLVERELARLWQAQLGDRRINLDDDFFDAGGHSLRALLLVASIRSRMGVELSLTEVFDHPTLVEQAALIEERLVEVPTSGAGL